jgi:3-hydroxyisobutyrate dehydrogenase
MKRVGYIGMGIMGRPMAMNLLNAGFEVEVWNRTKAKADEVIAAGAKWADSPADVAVSSQVVCINVTDTPDVEQVIFGKKGIVEGNPGDTAGLVVIDHSTIDPDATRNFAERLQQYEIDMLDAPVSGGDTGAKAGTLSIMVGGEEEVFARCLPILEAEGKAITHVGSSGMGQVCKACNQVLCALNLLATCEAMALAKAQGLDVAKMIEVTGAGAGGSWQLSNLGPKIAAGDLEPGFMVDLLLKDLGIVREAASREDLPLLGTDAAANLFRAASKMGLGRKGTQAISKVLESLGGFRYCEE